MRLLMIDNYDSFTWNLVQELRGVEVRAGTPDTGRAGAGPQVDVVRNDALAPEALASERPEGVVLSPGPGPEDGGVSLEAVRVCERERIPLLGVCLGHQAIACALGAKLAPARRIMHGKVSAIEHDGQGVFAGLPSPFEATRYHSLAVDEGTLPSCLAVTARSEDGEIMGLRHASLPLEGVQFHPESVCTPAGPTLLANFARDCAGRATSDAT